MSTGGYTAKFGDALRRLAALDAGASGQPVGPQGPVPQTSPFDVGAQMPPNAQLQAGPLQQAAPQQAPGAIEQAAQPPAGQSVRKIIEDMGPKERNEMARGIKKQTGKSVDDLYAAMVKSGEIAPPIERKPNRKEKLPALAEALLRYAQNVGTTGRGGRGMDPGAAAATATLDTQGRRGALEQAQIEQDNALAEARRGEVQGVLSARTSRAVTLEDRTDERANAATVAGAKTKAESELQKQKDDADMARERVKQSGETARSNKTNGKTYTDKNGKVFVIDGQTASPLLYDDVEAVPVGQGAFKEPRMGGSRKVKRQLEGIPGGQTGASTLDPDTVYNRRSDRIKEITANSRKMRELEKRAKEEGVDVGTLVNAEVDKLMGPTGGPSDAGNSGASYDYVPGKGLVKRGP